MARLSTLEGLRVWELSSTTAAAFAGRLLADLGAEVELFEGSAGHALRRQPPLVSGESSLFDYLSHGKRTRSLADALAAELTGVHAVIHDGPLPVDLREGLESVPPPPRGRVVAAVTPYGQTGPKRSWQGSELSLYQAGGEGYLTPSGLAQERFPDRSPIGIGRYVANYQAGLTVGLTLLAGLRVSRRTGATEWIDISVQEAQLSLNYFTVSRLVDGAVENRVNRAFKYGGVVPCRDGYVEILTLEEKQWAGLIHMLGDPEWAAAPRFRDPIERARNGVEINLHLRAWAAERPVAEVVALAAANGAPCGPYVAPEDLAEMPQLRARGFFREVEGRLRPGVSWAIERVDAGGAQ